MQSISIDVITIVSSSLLFMITQPTASENVEIRDQNSTTLYLLSIDDGINWKDYLRSYFAPLDEDKIKWRSFFGTILLNQPQFQYDWPVKDGWQIISRNQVNIRSFMLEPETSRLTDWFQWPVISGDNNRPPWHCLLRDRKIVVEI
jgi:hypothetical protein